MHVTQRVTASRAPTPFRDSVDDVMLVFGGRAYTGERYACHHPLDSAALTLSPLCYPTQIK